MDKLAQVWTEMTLVLTPGIRINPANDMQMSSLNFKVKLPFKFADWEPYLGLEGRF